MRLFSLLTALLLLLFTGCTNTNRPEGLDAPTMRALGLDEDVIFQPGVRYLTPAQSATATIAGDTLSFPVRDNPWAADVATGHILWSPQGKTWEQTFARRVEAIERRQDWITVRTREVGLSAIFKSMSVTVGRAEDTHAAPPGGEDERSFSETMKIANQLLPDSLAGLSATPQHYAQYEDSGISINGSSFQGLSKSWSRTPSDPDAARIYLTIRNMEEQGGLGFRETAADVLKEGGWYRARHSGAPVYERYWTKRRYQRYRHEQGWMQILAHDQFLVTVSGRVDPVFKRIALDDLDLSPLHLLADVDSRRGADAVEASTPDRTVALPDTATAAALRQILPYRLGGLPRAGRSVFHDRNGDAFQARAVWTERPYTRSAPRLIIAIQDYETPRGRSIALRELQVTHEWERTHVAEDGSITHERPAPDGSGGAIQWPVARRFTVYVEGRNVPMEQVRAAADQIDDSRLRALADRLSLD